MAAPTLGDFRDFFPDDFNQALDPLVTAKLEAAIAACSETFYGAEYKFAVLYLTAHYLNSAPQGADARLLGDELGATIYGQRFLEIKARHAGRWVF